MFGPLNGVRVALVIAAAVAALVAAARGQWVVTVVLTAGIAIHGAGWWHLYRRARQEEEESRPTRSSPLA